MDDTILPIPSLRSIKAGCTDERGREQVDADEFKPRPLSERSNAKSGGCDRQLRRVVGGDEPVRRTSVHWNALFSRPAGRTNGRPERVLHTAGGAQE